jgi:DNA-binding CsgD family transcriptional regulator
MALRTRYDRWLDLAVELTEGPPRGFPHERILTGLSDGFGCLASWHWQSSDGSFAFDLSHDVPGLRAPEVVEQWAALNRELHPLLWWYGVTQDPRPTTVDLVPRRLAPAGAHATVRELCRPFGIERQLAIPYALSPSGHRAFVLARSGADFPAEDVELARRIQPLIALVDRRTRSRSQPISIGRMDAGVRTGLTGRELAVLDLLAEGRTAEGIGHALAVSPRTVHSHLGSIYRKLQVGDRLRAVVRAEELGLLPTPGRRAQECLPSQVVHRAPAAGQHPVVAAQSPRATRTSSSRSISVSSRLPLDT